MCASAGRIWISGSTSASSTQAADRYSRRHFPETLPSHSRRLREALILDIEDLDLASGTFRLIGKGDGERFGYLSEGTTKLIRRYLRERGRPGKGPLFESRQGRLSYAMARTLFKRYAEGLVDGQPLTIHQLRHSFGSERAGQMDALILRDLMGHKSLRTTQQYAKVNPEAAQRAFREFDRKRTG